MKSIIIKVASAIIKFIGWFIPQNKKAWFCIPGITNQMKMDLLNYTNESILSLMHHICTFHNDENIKIFLVIYTKERYKELKDFIDHLKNIKIDFVFVDKNKFSIIQRLHYYICFYSSKYILVYSPFERHLKLKKQVAICINYYVPFKLDLIHNQKKNNIDYVIMSSNIACQIDSIATSIPYSKYRYLGLPKEDHIINPRFSKNELFKRVGIHENIKKIVLYAPTHRDYERINAIGRSIFGYDGDYDSLNKILIKHNAKMIVKLHYAQEKKHILYTNDFSNIQLYQSTYEYTVDDILPYVDLLITDYSSISFDFMLTGKPIIYNFFDREVYEKARGFSWNPVEIICVGPIVKTKQELETAIDNNLSNENNIITGKYEWVRQLTHAYSDGGACERIYLFLKQLM